MVKFCDFSRNSFRICFQAILIGQKGCEFSDSEEKFLSIFAYAVENADKMKTGKHMCM